MIESGTPFFRTFREGDETGVLRVLNETSSGAYTMDEWAWQFPPQEGGRAIVVGERNGELAAVCAGNPLKVTMDGHECDSVELRKLVSLEPGDARRVVGHFVETFGEGGRFALISAMFQSHESLPAGFVTADGFRISTLVRERPTRPPLGRLRYRAEPARDWEPRLDGLWQRARSSYPVAVVRDADRALRRFAARPTMCYHRFIVCPRFSNNAVAFAVFAMDGMRFRWIDLLWDHDHPRALDLLAHLSGRLINQLDGVGEELWLAGDSEACALLMKNGFRPDESPTPPVMAARSFTEEIDAKAYVERSYLTLADMEGLNP